jgi:predicted site-specific integrase-resolvase
MPNTPFLSQKHLSQALSISERTLERWRLEGSGPIFIKAGRRVLYRWEDVERWLAQGAHQSTSEAGGRR